MICRQEGLPVPDRRTIEALQLEKLNALLRREKRRGGFYAALPERLERLDALAELPFTTAADLAASGGRMLLCSQSAVQRVISGATSGTTGAAKRIFYTEADLENTVELYEAGLGELIFPGNVAAVAFPFSGPYGLGDLIAEAVTRLGAKPVKLDPSQCFGDVREALDRDRPDVYVGMPVPLLSLLRFCGPRSLRRALVSGDSCPESVMRGCETLLGSRLFPHYGSREMGMAGAICCPAHAGMHLRENHVIAEIVDERGRVLPPGETGELVITTVGMEAMPLIRYRTGDRTRLLPGLCPCGSAVIRIDRVSRGEPGLCAEALDEVLFADEHIVDCRCERSGDLLSVFALTDGAPEREALLSRLRALAPALSVELTCRQVGPKDRPFFAGKRVLKTL